MNNAYVKQLMFNSSIFGWEHEANESFSVPLIDFDPAVGAALVREAANINGGKEKFLIGILRGVGGGKTRTLEEIKSNLLLRDPVSDVLAIAITFNTIWGIRDDVYVDSNKAMRVVYPVVVRMLCMFYGLDLYTGNQMIKKAFPAIGKINEEELLSECCKHIVGRVRKEKPISTFVLMIDESLKLTDKNMESKDHFQAFRNVFLGNDIEDIKTAMVMSSLCYNPFAIALRERDIRSIQQPMVLNSTKIVHEYFLPSILKENETVDSSDKLLQQLHLLAVSMNGMPRMVEFFGNILRKIARNQSQKREPFRLDRDAIVVLMKMGRVLIRGRYSGGLSLFPTDRYLRALIFQTSIVADDTVMDLIELSTFTTMIDKFPKKITSKPVIIPTTSFFYFMEIAAEYAELYKSNTDDPNLEIADIVSSLSKTFTNCIKDSNAYDGLLMEETLIKWSQVRLWATALDTSLGHVSLRRFLAISGVLSESSNKLSEELQNVLKKTMPVINYIETFGIENSVKYPIEWIAGIAGLDTDDLDETAFISHGTQGERYDLWVTILLDNQPFTIIFDAKSKQESVASDKDYSKVKWKQFEKFQEFIDSIPEQEERMYESSMDSGSHTRRDTVLQSLKNGNFLYVYLTTYEGDGVREYRVKKAQKKSEDAAVAENGGKSIEEGMGTKKETKKGKAIVLGRDI